MKTLIAAFAIVALITASAGASENLLEACQNGVEVSMVVVEGVVSPDSVIQCIDGVTPTPVATPQLTPKPTATKTPTPTSTPVPTSISSVCSNRSLCPSGCLITPAKLYGYQLSGLDIPLGEVRTWCAPVTQPYVTNPNDIEEIKFNLYDESDRGCGFLSMYIEQTVGTKDNKSTAAISNGNILYKRNWGPFEFPDRVAPGLYRITVTGAGGCATTFKVGWSAK